MEDRADDVLDLLAGFALFSDLSTPELESVAETMDEQWYKADQRIIRQGLTGAGFYIILAGTASIRLDIKHMASLGPGDFFGEISCLLGGPPVTDIVAEGPLRVLHLPCDQLETFLIAHPRIMYRVLQGAARKIKNTTRWSGTA